MIIQSACEIHPFMPFHSKYMPTSSVCAFSPMFNSKEVIRLMTFTMRCSLNIFDRKIITLWRLLCFCKSQNQNIVTHCTKCCFKRILLWFCACSGSRTKPISEVLCGEVSKVDFILKNLSLYFTSVIRSRFVWIIFYSGV